jgi:putative membrane protein
MNLLLSWLILSVAVWLTAVILPGFEVRGFKGAVIVAAIYGLLSVLLGKLLFFVIGVATLGIGFVLAFVTKWVVFTLLVKLTDALSESLTVKSWQTAGLAALLMTGIGEVGRWALGVG